MITMIGSEVLFLVCLLSSVSMVITQGMMNAVGAIGGGNDYDDNINCMLFLML